MTRSDLIVYETNIVPHGDITECCRQCWMQRLLWTQHIFSVLYSSSIEHKRPADFVHTVNKFHGEQ